MALPDGPANNPSMNEMTPLAMRLKAIMEERGLKAAPLARSAGVGVDFVRDILRGHVRAPRIDNLAKLAAQLDMTVEELLGETIELPAPGPGLREAGQLMPWIPPPPREGSHLPDPLEALRAFCPEADQPAFLKASRASPSLGIFAGDLVAIDLKREPREGDLVAVSLYDEAGESAGTVLRRLVPPYLVPVDPALAARPELRDPEGARNTVKGPVLAVIRTKGSGA